MNQCPVLLAPEDKTGPSSNRPGDSGSSVPGIRPIAVTTESTVQPWKPQIISGEKLMTARIGPTGGRKGYTAITGQPSWGIAWYINDLLIPDIYVERGETYTFQVEGGTLEIFLFIF